MASFAIFTAKDIQSLVTELNAWGASMENFTTEVRSAVVSTAVETETLRNGIALFEMRMEQIGSVGNQAVHEIEEIMASFRAEIIFNKEERLDNGPTQSGQPGWQEDLPDQIGGGKKHSKWICETGRRRTWISSRTPQDSVRGNIEQLVC